MQQAPGEIISVFRGSEATEEEGGAREHPSHPRRQFTGDEGEGKSQILLTEMHLSHVVRR